MNTHKIAFIGLSLLVAACSDSGTESKPAPTAQDADTAKESTLTEQTKTWTEETKKLGAAAWDSTKEAAEKAADKTQEYYEAAKKKK